MLGKLVPYLTIFNSQDRTFCLCHLAKSSKSGTGRSKRSGEQTLAKSNGIPTRWTPLVVRSAFSFFTRCLWCDLLHHLVLHRVRDHWVWCRPPDFCQRTLRILSLAMCLQIPTAIPPSHYKFERVGPPNAAPESHRRRCSREQRQRDDPKLVPIPKCLQLPDLDVIQPPLHTSAHFPMLHPDLGEQPRLFPLELGIVSRDIGPQIPGNPRNFGSPDFWTTSVAVATRATPSKLLPDGPRPDTGDPARWQGSGASHRVRRPVPHDLPRCPRYPTASTSCDHTWWNCETSGWNIWMLSGGNMDICGCNLIEPISLSLSLSPPISPLSLSLFLSPSLSEVTNEH